VKPRHPAAGSNVTTENATEQKLCERLRVIESYLDSSATVERAGTYVRDFESNEHFWSPELFRLWGLPVADRAPSTDQFRSILGKAPLDGILAAVHRCIEERRRLELDYVMRLPNGAVRHLRSIGQGVPSRAGRGPAIMGAVVDLTEYRRACGALHDAFGLLGESNGNGQPKLRPSELVIRLKAPAGSHPLIGSGGPEAPTLPAVESRGNRRAAPCASAFDDDAQYRVVRGGLSARQFRRVCDLIVTRLREPLEVAELAAAAGVSASHFARAFKLTTGKGPHQFILEHRLECARMALASAPPGKLSCVAIEFGFFDQSHFTRHFRRKFGLTPGEFLRQGIARE
jgi:AraC-like DNA-binding protein